MRDNTYFKFSKQNLATAWNTEIQPVEHNLGEHPLFSDEALARLVEGNAHAIREVSTMDPEREDKSAWKRGSIEGMSGRDVIEAVRDGLYWVNVGDVGRFDKRYQDFIDQLMGMLENQVPGLKTFNRHIGVLISSPGARVYYHSDVPGQGLLHVRGEKTIWIYPGGDPFLPQESLERVVTGLTNEDIEYDPSFEQHASRILLTPGTGALWPLNWPHRVVNGKSLNVSVTVSFWTDEIRRHALVNTANGVLRHVMGLNPRSRAISGPSYWWRAGLAAAWKASGFSKRYREKYKAEFKINQASRSKQAFKEAAE
jgi:hypothetical protein